MPDEIRIWEGINDIRERTTRIETELRGINSQISERCRVREERLSNLEERQIQHERDIDIRFRGLEQRLWIMVGASAALSAVATTIFPHILKAVLS